jgi:hypothetical protein
MALLGGRLLRPAVIAGSLLAANVALSGALAVAALRPRPLRLVPSARSAEELLPGAVPEAAVREFALRYVTHFDNYTPGTIDAAEQAVKRMVSARTASRAAQGLERRRTLSTEGRMASQAIPVSASVEGSRATVEALRRIFVSDKLSRESRVRYRLELERQPPTELNPFGLAVVSQEIEDLGGER